jgi:RNA polymerase sigma-70 factor (ECF subfamily)
MPISDTEIIDKVRGGARHHFAALVDRYKDRAMTLSIRMLKNRQDAEEATQDAFVRAYNGLDKFEGTAKFGTWFYRILYNVCLTKIGNRKEGFVEYDDGMEYADEQRAPFGGAGPERKGNLSRDLETRDMIEFIKTIIEKLPPKYSTILSLFYFQELSHEEICEVTRLPLGTVKVHLFRARALLQERLQKEQESVLV